MHHPETFMPEKNGWNLNDGCYVINWFCLNQIHDDLMKKTVNGVDGVSDNENDAYDSKSDVEL